MRKEYATRICQGIFHEYTKGWKTTHTPSTPMSKYTKIQKKIPTIKTTQNALKYKAKTLYY